MTWLKTRWIIMAASSALTAVTLTAATVEQTAAQNMGCAASAQQVEITQAVSRDPRISTVDPIPLVAFRRTAVRIYARDSCTQYVDGWIRLKKGTQIIAGPFRSGNLANVPTSTALITRSNLGETLNVEVPAKFLEIGTGIVFEIVVKATGQTPTSGDWGEGFVTTPEFFGRFAPNVLGVRVNYQFSGADTGDVGSMSAAVARKADKMVWGTWPFPEPSGHYIVDSRTLRVDFEVNNDPSNLNELMALLDTRGRNSSPRPNYTYGLFRGDNISGWSYVPGPTGYGSGATANHKMIFAHELGHGVGAVDHSGSTTLELGLDIKNAGGGTILKPTTAPAIMCCVNNDNVAWQDVDSYLAMFDAGAPGGGGGAFAGIGQPLSAPINTTTIELQRVGSPAVWTIGNLTDIRTSMQAIAPTSTGHGVLKALNSAGTVLYQTAILVPEISTSEALATNFIAEIPETANVNKIEVYEGGVLKDSKTRSANAPSVTITSPSASSTLTSSTSIEWTATDADSNPLVATVEYSASTDRHVALATNFTGNQLTFDPTGLPASSSAVIRVRVTDGFNTTVATVGGLTSGSNNAPEVGISSPDTGTTFRYGSGEVFDAYANDLEDGTLPAGSISWSSSLDGSLGTGYEISAQLSIGAHTITVTATDSSSSQTTDTILVTVTS